MPDEDKIKVERRRKGSGPEGKPRAEAPSRERPRTGGGAPPTGGPASAPRPSGGMKLPIWLVIPIVLLYLVYSIFSGGDNNEPESYQPIQQEQEIAEAALPTATPLVNLPSLPAAEGQTWLMMLYQDADDQILEKDIYLDLNEAEMVGSTDRVHIVAQMDRFQAAFTSDGNWTSTRRYYITRDSDLSHVDSQLIQDLGEVNMSAGQTLVDFVTWAIATFPADRYVLILSDHGMGWPGGWSDATARGHDANPAPLAAKLEDHLWLSEIDQALGQIRQETGIDKLDIIGMDACLMAQVEVFSTLQPHAYYAIASEETEPALGWAYTGFLSTLTANPDMSAAELSRTVVESYIQDDQRILDPVERQDLASQGSPLAGLLGFGRATPEQLTQQLERDITLSAVDLSAVPALMQSLNDFAYLLQNEDQSIVASGRAYARSYTSIFGQQVPASFIDLGNFVQLVGREATRTDVRQAAQDVLDTLQKTIIAERHGPGKNGSTGMAIYYPNATLYSSAMAGPQSYTVIADHFAAQSLWDDFLAYHYHNHSFEKQVQQPYLPTAGTPTRAPGQADITVSPIQLSADVAAPGQPVELSVDISGKNIGYVYLFVGYYDQASNSIYMADTDYLESPETRQLDGVYYPQWSKDEAFTLAFSWDPYIFAVSDGENLTPALFNPQSYGAAAEDAVYTVDGIYTFSGTGESLPARLYFRDGQLNQVFGFQGESELGAPHEISPQIGDTFTILDKWMELGSGGSAAEISYETGDTLTFHEESFHWEEIYAAAGVYVVGFIIEDLEGNTYPVYTQVTVE
jgi:hypothetical protein